MYCRYATLLHLPMVLIMESSIPFAAAVVVATSILKLCPLYFDWSIPAFCNASFTADASRCLVRSHPSLNLNSGPL